MDSSPTGRRHDGRVFGLLFLVYTLFVLFPILRANRPCNDDLARMLIGVYSWDVNGRPLTTLLMRTLEFKLSAMVDIAPLPQLLAVALLALAGALIARRYAIASPWLAALLALPLGAQPFFLENLSFRFDAPAMALAIVLALLPVTLLRAGHLRFWLGAVCLLGCLCSYQPVINVFALFALLDLLAMQAESATPGALARQVGRYVLQILIAMCVYQWKVVPGIGEWVQEHSQTIHSFHQVDVLLQNARVMGTYLLDAWPHRWMGVFMPLLALSAAASLMIGLRYAVSVPRALWLKACMMVLAVLVPLAALACLAGPMLLLVSPVIMPRVFPSVGALVSVGLLAVHMACTHTRRPWAAYVAPAFAAIWALGMLGFAGIYGNALSAQQSYEDRIASSLADDIAEVRVQHHVTQILLDGSAGYAPLAAHAVEQFHLLNTLVLPYLSARDFNSRNFLKHYGMGLDEARQDSANDASADALLARACAAPVLVTKSRYALRLVDSTAVVTLPGGLPTGCPASP